jgi:hypothetical protein
VGKQELVDEQKRMKISESKRIGQLLESRPSHEIPFGVRAIQSGIQIDGIWISNCSTPIASTPKLVPLRGISTDFVPSIAHARDSFDTPLREAKPLSSRGRPLARQSAPPVLSFGGAGASDDDPQERSGSQFSYKPRRSSRLRIGSEREAQCNEETLNQLEGKVPIEKVDIHQSSDSYYIEQEGYISSGPTADHGIFSDSDACTSNNHRSRSTYQYHPGPRSATRPSKILPFANSPLSQLSKMSLVPHSSYMEYFSLPISPTDSPGSEISDPLNAEQSPFEVPLFVKAPNAQDERDTYDFSESHIQDLSRTPPPPLFVAGELHVNKVVRNVNSGFEVLPAGTFGNLPELQRKGIIQDERWTVEEEKRRSNRLQKNDRYSSSAEEL